MRGRRCGLIGRNGKGKSTLLRGLASRRVGGIPDGLTVHYVSQEVHLSEEAMGLTAVALVIDADVERRLLMAEAAALQASEKPDVGGCRRAILRRNFSAQFGAILLTLILPPPPQAVHERLDEIGADSVELRATKLLQNLGFSPELLARPCSALSGGWRVRAALAAAMFARPDLLLLDEPTNHLSIGAVLWLAHELRTSDVWKERIM